MTIRSFRFIFIQISSDRHSPHYISVTINRISTDRARHLVEVLQINQAWSDQNVVIWLNVHVAIMRQTLSTLYLTANQLGDEGAHLFGVLQQSRPLRLYQYLHYGLTYSTDWRESTYHIDDVTLIIGSISEKLRELSVLWQFCSRLDLQNKFKKMST